MRILKNILQEQERYSLTDTQKAVILSIKVAPTAELAYDAIKGTENAVTARDALERLGYINVNHATNQATLTQNGEDVVEHENMVDETGEITERGEEILATYREDKSEWQQFGESFSLFRGFVRI